MIEVAVPDGGMTMIIKVEASVDAPTKSFNWLHLKDQTTGTIYKLKVDSGTIILEEVVE